MDDPRAMDVAQAEGDLRDDPDGLQHRGPPLLFQQSGERPSRNILHDEERQAAMAAGVEYADDVRVRRKALEDLDLALEPFARACVLEAREQLHGDARTIRGRPRLVDCPEASPPELALEAVSTADDSEGPRHSAPA
jgi:hypothetical protein